MVRHSEVYPFCAILVNNKKEQTANMMNLQKYAQGKKTDIKGHMLYPEMSRKDQSIEKESRLVAADRPGWG